MNEQLFIPTIADLERILDEHPEIRESLRRKLLTDDERQLPKVVERLADNLAQLTRTVADGFAEASADRAAIRKEMADGFAEASADRAAIRKEMADGFAEASADRAAIRKEMADGFAEASADRAAIRKEMADGFAEASADRAAIRKEMADGFAEASADRVAIRKEMADGFAEASADRVAIRKEMADGFAAAAADRVAIRKEMADGFAEASADRDTIKAGQQRLEGQFNQFRGEMYEARVQPRAVSWTIISMGFTNPVISRPVNAGNTPEFNSILQQALSSNRITREEAMDLCSADLIISGDSNQHIIAEISITADDSDLERAVRRAGIMQQATNGSCTPAIIAQNIPEPLSGAASDQGAATVIFT